MFDYKQDINDNPYSPYNQGQNDFLPQAPFLNLNMPINESHFNFFYNINNNMQIPSLMPMPVFPDINAQLQNAPKNVNTGIQSYKIFGPLNPLNSTKGEIETIKYNINIIYYEEKMKNNIEYNRNCSFFKDNLEGTFYGINNFELFKYLCYNIQSKMKYYILICPGSCAEKLFDFCALKNINQIYIYIIYCMNRQNYLPLFYKYSRLKYIFTEFEDLHSTIFRSPTISNPSINSSNLIFLRDYNDTYIKLHFEIIRKYSIYKLLKDNDGNKSKFLELVNNKNTYYKNMARELLYEDDETLVYYFKMKTGTNEQNLRKVFNYNHNIKEYISNYTVESFYYEWINKFLREGDLKSFRLLSNHLAKFIYHLKEYRKKNYQSSLSTLYRSMYISKQDLQIYLNSIGKVICYPSFTSTSIEPNLFVPNPKHLEGIQNPVSVKLIIEQNNSQSIIRIKELSKYSNEEEYLFLPFSFFKITNVIIKDELNLIYLTALNSEKPIEEIFLDFMENETDNLDPEGLEMIQLINNGTTLILNPTLKKLIHEQIDFNY